MGLIARKEKFVRSLNWSLIALLALASGVVVHATSLAGVAMPDAVQVGTTTLFLNGMGLRTKLGIKVYVLGLYVTQKSQDPAAILKADAPKQVLLQFLHSASKSQMSDAFNRAFAATSLDTKKTLQAEIDRLLSALEAVEVGDKMVFNYVPATGTTLAVNGTEKVTIAGSAFGQMLFSVWLGPKPPNADLKMGILGQQSRSVSGAN